MSHRATAIFDNVAWEQTPYDQVVEGPSLHRASVRRHFYGEIKGYSTAELLLGTSDDSNAGYLAFDRFVGTIGERSGSCVFQHGGAVERGAARSFGNVLPGSGTGELHGLRGELRITVTPAGEHALTLDYEL